jgi:hypothetical protein
LVEGIAVLSLAAVAAKLLAPVGTSYLVEAFWQQPGLQFDGVLLGPTIVGSVRGLYTLVTWSTFIIAGQRSLAKRSVRPLWLPLILGLVLAMVRPVATLDDLSVLWGERALRGDGVAIFSLLSILGVAAFLVGFQLKMVYRPANV